MSDYRHILAALSGPTVISDEGYAICDAIMVAALNGKTDPATYSQPPRRVTIEDGIGILPIEGPIFRKASLFTNISGATSTEAIRSNLSLLRAEYAKGNVHTILMNIDSPGGEAQGVLQTGNMIHEIATKTSIPVIAHIETGASGAYWLASQANEIVVAPDGITGSIGVVVRISDASRLARNAGLDEHVLKTGPNKAIGTGPVTDANLDELRVMRDKIFADFVAAVEMGRGRKLSEDVLTGKVYRGADAVTAGLADRVATYTETLASLK